VVRKWPYDSDEELVTGVRGITGSPCHTSEDEESVIPSILIPLERDTKEWASSWVKRNEKNRTVPTDPLIRCSPVLSSGVLARRTAAVKVARMRKKEMNQEQLREISNPAIDPTRILRKSFAWQSVLD